MRLDCISGRPGKALRELGTAPTWARAWRTRRSGRVFTDLIRAITSDPALG